MELTLSKHFQKRWWEHFRQEPPSPYRIMRIISQSVWLQKGRLLMEPDGTQYKLLSTYWHPGMGIVIKVDRLVDPPQAVTLITGKSKGNGKGLRPGGTSPPGRSPLRDGVGPEGR